MRYVSLGDAGGTSGGKHFTSISLGGGADGARGRKPWMSIELGGGADGARGRMRCVGIKLGGGVVGGFGTVFLRAFSHQDLRHHGASKLVGRVVLARRHRRRSRRNRHSDPCNGARPMARRDGALGQK